VPEADPSTGMRDERVRRKSRESLPKRTRESTRDLMLRAGAQLAKERVSATDEELLPSALAHIRLTEVVEAATALAAEEAQVSNPAPITTGAIYQIWPSQADYQGALLRHLIQDVTSRTPDFLTSEALTLLGQGLDGTAVISRLADTSFRIYREDSLTYLYYCFYSIASIPEVRDELGESSRRFDGRLLAMHEALLSAAGRGLKAGVKMEDLVATLVAVVEGFTLRWRVDPGTIREGDDWCTDEEIGTSVSLIGLAAKSIVEGFTEPADETPETESPGAE
jgi:hypothetical protein